jgi:S1-C subfamily serine protease
MKLNNLSQYAIPVILIVLIAALVFYAGNLQSETKESTAKKGYLGVAVDRLSPVLKKQLKLDYGVVVTWIDEEGPADKAGILEDDIIIEVDKTPVKRPETLSRVVQKLAPETNVNIVYLRDGKKESTKATLAKAKQHCYSADDLVGFQAPLMKCFGSKSDIFIGVKIQDLNDDLASYFGVKPDQGVLVLKVMEDSPASEAGVKAGDILTKIDGEAIKTTDDVLEMLTEYDEGDEISIELLRHNAPITYKLKVEGTDMPECRMMIKKLPRHENFDIDIEKFLPKHNFDKKIIIKHETSDEI